jgi:hypothetical protein
MRAKTHDQGTPTCIGGFFATDFPRLGGLWPKSSKAAQKTLVKTKAPTPVSGVGAREKGGRRGGSLPAPSVSSSRSRASRDAFSPKEQRQRDQCLEEEELRVLEHRETQRPTGRRYYP